MNATKDIRPRSLVFLFLLSFLLMFGYSLARPATESLFLDVHTSKSLPFAWVLVGIFVVLAAHVYNQYAVRMDLFDLIGKISLASALGWIFLLGCLELSVSGVYYALYVFKDVSIIVLVETFYTIANTLFSMGKARKLYGFFVFFGTIGSMVGNWMVGRIANAWGTEMALWLVPGLLFGCWLCAKPAKPDHELRASPNISKVITRKSFRLIRKSRYLLILLLTVVAVQVAINVIDYQFNQVLEENYPSKDQRTNISGRIYFLVDVGTLLFGALAGWILKTIKIPLLMVAMPFFLLLFQIKFFISPTMLSMSIAKIVSKIFDYSLFRISKEILYIPLSFLEKTVGKSLVDMTIHRNAKVMAGLLILLLQSLALSGLISMLGLLLSLSWLLLAYVLGRRFMASISCQQE